MKTSQRKLIAAMSLCAIVAVPNIASAASVSGQGTWESTLLARDLDGNLTTAEAYYDTVLNITWLANANVAGTMNWATANAWAAGLDVNGITGWRLPTNTPINGTSFNTAISNNATTDRGYADADGWVDGSSTPVSEMGHLFYVTLGNLGACTPNNASPGSCTTQTGSGLSNTGPFSNVQAVDYWSGSELNSSNAWRFLFNSGGQFGIGKTSNLFAWAVRSGDVSASVVPVPAAAWLFGSGLLGLIGFARKKAA